MPVIEKDYNTNEVYKLQGLLPVMISLNTQLTELVHQLLDKIKIGLLMNAERNHVIDNFIEVIRQIPKEHSEMVREMFYNFFYAGMYMRKWKGSGNKYPINEQDTHDSINIDIKASNLLHNIQTTIDYLKENNPTVISYYEKLPSIDYNTISGEISFLSDTLNNIFTSTYDGNRCIRMASRKIVLTSYYYLGTLYEEIIPEFDPYDVDKIQ